MSNSARRAIYHRIRHLSDDRTVRVAAIVALVIIAVLFFALLPATQYSLEGSRCKEFSSYLVICPKPLPRQ